MRPTSAVALLAATAPIAVSAKGRLGFSLGVRNSDGSCKSTEEFSKDFAALEGTGAKIVRTYSALDGAIQPECKVPGAILPAAEKAGIQVIIGLWADNEDLYQKEKTEVLKYAKDYSDSIYAFTIGSEGLYRRYEQNDPKAYTAKDILGRINDFKDTITDSKQGYNLKQKVGTADSWNKFDDGAANLLIEGGVNFLLVNAFGYWQSQDISNATATYLDDLQRAYGKIQSLAGSTTSIELWNGETGWPTDGGSTYHDDTKPGYAVASTDNAETFYKESVCAALDWNFNVFYFSAFAEPWKPDSEGDNKEFYDEKHWGAFDADRKPIIDLTCSYPY